MHCKCDNFGCRWMSRVFSKSLFQKRNFWDKPKEVQLQKPEPILSVCHRGCQEINSKKIKINRYRVMKNKYKEKFGSNPKNFTTENGIIYPVKTLVTKGKCKNGRNKGDRVFLRAKCSCGSWKYSSVFENWNECMSTCSNGKCSEKCSKDVYGCRWAIWKGPNGDDPWSNNIPFDEWVDERFCPA